MVRLILAGVVSALSVLPQTAGVRPGPGRPACKIFPTEVSSVSNGAAGRTLSTYTARYDRATNQLHTDITYSYSSGTRQQMHYVHHYASVADFINEVVRESGYRGRATTGQASLNVRGGFFEPGDAGHGLYLSAAFAPGYRTVTAVTNRNALTASGAGATSTTEELDWSINTIPPLKLYSRAVVTGDVQSTSANTFDAQGRQTGFTNTTPGSPTQTTTYTAWDSQGRPTRGSRTAPAGTGNATVDIVYDDLARTMTTTVRTPTSSGPQVFVDAETFDVNGNVRRYDMKSTGGTSTTTNTLRTLEAICHNGLTPPVIK